MNKGIKSIIYPVTELEQAKAQFRTLLGADPYTESPYYVGFKVGDLDVGLDPNGHKDGATVYYHVADIQQSLQALVESGAQVVQPVKDIGAGGVIASVRNADGNIIGLIQ
jgi:predicted enzyme related to lactoylglutathione lyase